MNEELLKELLELVNNVSPLLWSMAERQVAVINFQDAFFVFLLPLISFLSHNVFGKELLKRDEYGNFDHDEAGPIFLIVWYVLTAIFSVVVVVNIVSIIMRLLNPEYYTLQILMKAISGQ